MGVESGGTRSRTRFVRHHPFIFTHLYSSTKRFSKSIFGRLYYVERRLRAAASKALLRRSTYIYIYIERERDSRDFCALRLYYYHHHHHHHRFIEAARGASSMDFDVPQSSSSGTLILKCSMIASIFRSSFSVR